MNILFLIGNGFDINIGMKTKYKDFYNYYLNQNSKSDIIIKIKKEIKNDIDNWSDLELKLGEYLDRLKEEKEAILIYNDITKELQKYLQEEEDKYNYNIDTNIVYKDLLYPENHLRPIDIQYIKNNWKKELDTWQIRIISFNYTRAIEKIIAFNNEKLILETTNTYQKYVDAIEHIHGYANERMILGVNDANQIKNQALKVNKKIVRRFIKPECNKTYGLGHDEKCNKWINNANIICLYGLSIGDTDKLWWNRIAKHLINYSCILIIFFYDEHFQETGGPEYEDKADEIKEMFLSKVQLTELEKQNISNRIYVSFSRNYFNIKISPK